MIIYNNGGLYPFYNLFKIDGSVFPKAMLLSVPASLLTSVFVYMIYDDEAFRYFQDSESVMNNNAIWGGFNFLVGFLVVFRTSQAYSRFWEGATQTHKMGAEWFDACSSLMAFCKHSEEKQETIMAFQNVLVRLFSMLHAAALGDIEDCGEGDGYEATMAFNLDLIDAESIDVKSMQCVQDSDAKVELIFQWIQQLVVKNIKTGVLSIPPPILSRSFQEIATGMVHFHEAMKISNVPFPFPYAQTCDCLLFMHWLMVPFVVSQWCRKPWWAGLFCFIQVFTLWTLNLIAVELENPFGTDPNDIDGVSMQDSFNNGLRLLMEVEKLPVPTVNGRCPSHRLSQRELMNKAIGEVAGTSSFKKVWGGLSDMERETVEELIPPSTEQRHIGMASVRRYNPRKTCISETVDRRSDASNTGRRSVMAGTPGFDEHGFREYSAGSNAGRPTIESRSRSRQSFFSQLTRSNSNLSTASAFTQVTSEFEPEVVGSSSRKSVASLTSITESVLEFEGYDSEKCFAPDQALTPRQPVAQQSRSHSSGEARRLLGKWEPWDGTTPQDLRSLQPDPVSRPHAGSPQADNSQAEGLLHSRLGEIFFDMDETMEDTSANELLTSMSQCPGGPSDATPPSRQDSDRSALEHVTFPEIGSASHETGILLV